MAGASPPKILKPISARTLGQAGNRVNLEAVVVGRPVPVITWHKNGLPVTKDERHLMRYEDRGNCCLTMLNVNVDDEGEYECRARNRLGQVSCFGQLYIADVVGLEAGVKQMGLRQSSSTSQNETQNQQMTEVDDGNDEREGHSGLFILIDEGSQDENSADEMGRKESISASEQIESIIEDLRLRDGSLNFSLAKQGSCGGEQRPHLHHPSSSSLRENSALSKDQRTSSSTSTSGKPINFKDERIQFLNPPVLEFEDSVILGEDIPIPSRGRKSPKCLARNSNPLRPKVSVPLHKVIGLEDNLHRAFDDGSGNSSNSDSNEVNLHFAPLAEYEMIRSANINEGSSWRYKNFSYQSADGDAEEVVVNISPPPEFQNHHQKLDERRNMSEASCYKDAKQRNSGRMVSKQRSASDCHDRLTLLSRGNDDSASSPWESSEEVFEESLELESSVEDVFPSLAHDNEESSINQSCLVEDNAA